MKTEPTMPIELNDDILLKVQKPARYIGEEHNIVKKPWGPGRIKLCLCYPDTYEIGMSNLGLKILYNIINSRDDALCERSFAPWPDMETVMRDNSIPLFSLENKMPLSSFDIVGFSLQYELTYANVLNMLDLSNIPLKASERHEGDYPLIIAGGSCAFNPEPLADFIDLFVIGEAEEAVNELIDITKGVKTEKQALLRRLSSIDGLYVPSLYGVNDKNSLYPAHAGIPENVKKRAVKELGAKDFPVRPLVPYISAVHDRITLEIMRGCPNACRFCQASSIYGPVRVRKPEHILELAEESYKNTGLDEISLVSLSTSNYPYIEMLFSSLLGRFTDRGVNVSLPSLRIEEGLSKLPSLVSAVKKSGFTFAPEAGTERMLDIIKKDIRHSELFKGLKEAYALGWRRIKLYFMIGLPFEEEEDLRAIVSLSDKAALLRKEFSRHPADIIINISSFIPKPHTAFQWFGMDDEETLTKKQELIKTMVSGKRYLKLKFHDVKMSALEGVFSRGDRALGALLIKARDKGARFDAWSEHFNPALWDEAFAECGIDRNNYLSVKNVDEPLPWEHILSGVKRETLKQEYRQACLLGDSRQALG